MQKSTTMKGKTLRYFLLISLLSLFSSVFAQESTEKKILPKDMPVEEGLFTFKGISLSADLFGSVYRLFGNSISSEVAIDFNFRNQFFPVVEIGYGSSNDENEDNGCRYTTSAPYFRVGLNYNIFYRKGKVAQPSFGYVGVRYGFSAFSYDVEAPNLQDPVWGGSVPFDYNNVSGNYHWFELCGGIKAKIWKNFYMGWCIRYKARLSVKNSPHSAPWYVPGFGNSTHTTFGATYSIIYNLPL